MVKKSIILVLLIAFTFVISAWADENDSKVRSFSGKMPFAPGEIIVKFNRPHQLRTLFSVNGSASDQVKVKKLLKKNNKGKMSIASSGNDKIDEPGVYKLTYKDREDIYSIVDELNKDPDVEYAEPNYIYQTFIVPNDPSYSLEWGFSKIGAPSAWDVMKGDGKVVIAVIDTGVDYRHPDLATNIWVNANETPDNGMDDDGNGYVDDVAGWDFVSIPAEWAAAGEDPGPPDNDPMDFYGHGTHVSGIVAGKPNNGIGIAGAAWDCKIMPLRAGYMYVDGNGYLELEDIAEALYYAADNGASVINMSFGCSYNARCLREAVKYAHSKGCVMVSSAGNVDGYDAGQPFYPAAYDHVIAVASVDSADKISVWNMYAFSNFGDFVDICAPGTAILSTLPNGSYGYASGTSMASPFVAGVAALVISKHKDWTPEQVESRLKATADDIYAINTQSFLQGKLGAGRISAKKALGNLSMAITYPKPSSIISGSVVVKGSADIENFDNYKLECSSVSSPDAWAPIMELSSTPVEAGILAMWNVGNPDGQYNLRLTVSNTSGESYQSISGVNFGVDGEVKLSGRPQCGPSPYDPADGNFLFYYDLLSASDVDIYVYDISGTLVWQKVLPYDAGTSGGGGSAGTNRVFWDGENSFGETLSNGAYVYMIVARDSGERKVIGRGKFAVVRS
ncbi:MAG: S8 family serine peptidase [bacterium]